MAIDIHWITDEAALALHCDDWLHLPFVALDTEFVRVDTFYPQAGLLQVCAAGRVYLIDPLLIHDWSALAEVLRAPAVVKVLHSCSEDLEVLSRLTGSLPAPLFDTQLAAGYLNLGFSMGYSRLVQAVLGIELPKGETRSDWLQRPLSETQLSYAAEDALHLAEVYEALDARLSEEKRAWVLEDGAELLLAFGREVDPDELYREGKLPFGSAETVGLAEGAVGIVETGNFEKLASEETVAAIEAAKAAIAAGEVEVPTAFGMDGAALAALRDSVRP